MIAPSPNTYDTVQHLNTVCDKVKARVQKFQGSWQGRLNTNLTALSLYTQGIMQLKVILQKLEAGSRSYLHVQRHLEKMQKLYSATRTQMLRFKTTHGFS